MTRARARRRSTVVRPTAFGVSAAAVAAAVFAARSSINDPALAGLVWTVFAALVVVGVVWPLVAMRFVGADVVDAPADGVVGRPVRVRLRVRTPGVVDTVAIHVDGATGWWSATAGVSDLDVEPRRRGVVRSLGVTLSSDGPLGMITVSRHLDLALRSPLAIGPDPVLQQWTPPVAPEAGSDDPRGVATVGGDQVRSVRPYRPGDPAHLVHWPSSARVGSLVVRELEPPVRPGVVLVVDLGDPGIDRATDGPKPAPEPDPVAERSVAEAAGLALAVLRSGGVVVLCTCDEGRPVTAEVTNARLLGRRLAGAVPGPVGPLPGGVGWSTVVHGPGGRR